MAIERISEVQLNKCIEFAKLSAFTQQGIEFGQHDTAERGIIETAKDTMIGKVAEVAVANLLSSYGVHCPADFNIYRRGEWDDCDIKIFKWDIDVKASEKGKWLLIERDKLIMRSKQRFNNLPDGLIFCNVVWFEDKYRPSSEVCINGFISLQKFLNEALRLKKGDCIPNTATKLQADNFAVNKENLSPLDEQLIGLLYKATPPKKQDVKIECLKEE